MTPRKSIGRKLYVLDTNVLMHDPTSLLRFKEHDVCVPFTTLEELDHNKKGNSEVARNVREASRLIEELTASYAGDLSRGVPLAERSGGFATGNLLVGAGAHLRGHGRVHARESGDKDILATVARLRGRSADRHVILASKDINMRTKARVFGIPVEDYRNDQVAVDEDRAYTGVYALPETFWDDVAPELSSWNDRGRHYYSVSRLRLPSLSVNQFAYLDGMRPFEAIVRRVEGEHLILESVPDHTHYRKPATGIVPRNREQAFALHLLLDPDIDLVTLMGQAGSGKTLLALAAGLQQTVHDARYSEIIVTRATVPVGEDIGFLPGGEEEKMWPWMGAFVDNLEVLKSVGEGSHIARQGMIDAFMSRIKVRSMSFIRGRTFLNRFLIIDEAQNLTPKEMRTLVTRAGTGTKIVCLGNIGQIDTPYLTEGSSGLAYTVERMRDWPHAGHITLLRGERSRLASHAVAVL